MITVTDAKQMVIEAKERQRIEAERARIEEAHRWEERQTYLRGEGFRNNLSFIERLIQITATNGSTTTRFHAGVGEEGYLSVSLLKPELERMGFNVKTELSNRHDGILHLMIISWD